MLTCSCPDWDESEEWCYTAPSDFTVFSKKRRKRCCSCHELINKGADCLKFYRDRYAHSETEERIYGEGEPIAITPWYMCEACGEIFLNLNALGFCVDIACDMKRELEEYQQEYAGDAWEKFKAAYV